jgi:hypothetical protein
MGIATIAARRVVLAIAQMVIQLVLDDHFRQLPEQAAVAGQLQAAGARPLGELTQQLLIGRRQLRPGLVRSVVTSVIRCLLRFWSYTV